MARANELKIETSTPVAPVAPLPTAKPQPAQPTVKLIFVRTVYGDMLDLTTNIWYTQAPKEVIRITPWMQSQIDAKKMEVV